MVQDGSHFLLDVFLSSLTCESLGASEPVGGLKSITQSDINTYKLLIL